MTPVQASMWIDEQIETRAKSSHDVVNGKRNVLEKRHEDEGEGGGLGSCVVAGEHPFYETYTFVNFKGKKSYN